MEFPKDRGSIIDPLVLTLFGRDLLITVSPDRFVFRSRRAEFSLQTFMWISPRTGRVVTIGEEPPPGKETFLVDLFAMPPDLTQAKERFIYLECFLRYSLQRMANRRRLAVFRVTVENVSSLDEMLLGYQYELLTRALRLAGAKAEITFR